MDNAVVDRLPRSTLAVVVAIVQGSATTFPLIVMVTSAADVVLVNRRIPRATNPETIFLILSPAYSNSSVMVAEAVTCPAVTGAVVETMRA